MGNFGEDLRMERLSRGIALEDITAVTKISQRYLIALEQESFRLLPGGILSKGIVRSYVGALGLDPQDWTERYLKAYNDSGQMHDDDRSWTAFAPTLAKPVFCNTRLSRLGCAGSGLSCFCWWWPPRLTSLCAITACAWAGGTLCSRSSKPTPIFTLL